MNFFGEQPADDLAAEGFVKEALINAEQSNWSAAAHFMEMATINASSVLIDNCIEQLCLLYLNSNQFHKIANIIDFSESLSPVLVICRLAIERNRIKGFELATKKLPFMELLTTLRAYVANGKYSISELKTIISLLEQIGNDQVSIDLLIALIDAGFEIEEELVTAVLSLALEKKRKREAMEIVNKLSSFGNNWPQLVARYSYLLGHTITPTLHETNDKVMSFLLHENLLNRK